MCWNWISGKGLAKTACAEWRLTLCADGCRINIVTTYLSDSHASVWPYYIFIPLTKHRQPQRPTDRACWGQDGGGVRRNQKRCYCTRLCHWSKALVFPLLTKAAGHRGKDRAGQLKEEIKWKKRFLHDHILLLKFGWFVCLFVVHKPNALPQWRRNCSSFIKWGERSKAGDLPWLEPRQCFSAFGISPSSLFSALNLQSSSAELWRSNQ